MTIATVPTARTTSELAARFQRDATPLLPELHQRALRLTRNHHDAEDLVQDTMANAYRGYPTFKEGSNFRAWLYRIELNTYISDYRKSKRRPTQYPTAEVTELEVLADASGRGPRSAEDQALAALPNSDVTSAMRALPEQFRTAVYYADVAGYPFKEIAELTNAPIGTVMSRLHRGRRHLRRILVDAPIAG
jgi:RNA polymerase sigma-70 factor, ECF subfamily